MKKLKFDPYIVVSYRYIDNLRRSHSLQDMTGIGNWTYDWVRLGSGL